MHLLEIDIDKECNDVSISEGSFKGLQTDHSTIDEDQNSSLDKEPCLSAMLFTSMDAEDDLEFEGGDTQEDLWDLETNDLNLEHVSEMEGLRYVGGYTIPVPWGKNSQERKVGLNLLVGRKGRCFNQVMNFLKS